MADHNLIASRVILCTEECHVHRYQRQNDLEYARSATGRRAGCQYGGPRLVIAEDPEEGIVAGGGVALVRAGKVLDNFNTESEDTDEMIGVKIIRRALEEPLRQIAQNAGKEGAVIVEKVLASTEEGFGFNARTEKFEDLVAAGVIDPAKVTRTALQNAASIAGLMLTTEAMIADVQDEKGGDGGMGGAGMGI